MNILFTFQGTGIKYVRLTVTDAQFQTTSIQQNVIVAEPVSAVTETLGAYYVSPTGDDSGMGRLASPWRTIQKAANTLNAGETVVVTSGVYNERVQVSRSGLSGLPLTFQASGNVLMQGFNIQANFVKVVGFEITNTPGGGATDRSNGSGFYIRGIGNEVSGNHIHGSVAAGIYLSSASSNTIVSENRIAYAVECGIYIQGTGNLIRWNDISHTRSVNGSDADGIRFFGSGNIVRKNYIHDIVAVDSPGQSPHIDAFQTWGPANDYVFDQNLIDKQPDQHQGFTIEGITQAVSNIVIRNNVFISRGSGYQPDVSVGDMGLVSNVTIVNNTMVAVNSAEYAIWLFPGMSGAVVKNNAIYNHGNGSSPYIRVDAGAAGLDIGYNSISNSSGVAPRGYPYFGDLWMVSPRFVNFTDGDFHLQPTSPLIDRGASISPLIDDYDGAARPSGSLPDIGAFEFRLP
jgi:parallel beta-helix repeat protein